MEGGDISAMLQHLKTMEKSITYILMEAAFKLSQLTESQMFIMIETQEGRTFTGSSRLCEAYSTTGLYGQETDVQMQMDDEEMVSESFKSEESKYFHFSVVTMKLCANAYLCIYHKLFVKEYLSGTCSLIGMKHSGW